ncbi:MAG: methyl-accepting chemotaxis protein [Bacteroidales bacterium]|nr:methyl-accepting chemotaxis protein [Clostridium sp.]MCM1203194.1 methyl-accepting chemotaxis protein [Bacteroidales bacterium]
MKDMKMKTKMIIGFVIPTIFIIVNVWIGMSAINDISDKVADMQQEQIDDIKQTIADIGADEEKASIVINAMADDQAAGLASIEDRASKSNILSFALVVISVIITVFLSTAIIKAMRKSIEQLTNGAHEIAAGRVDVEMVKYHNDEFGELIDEYTHVIDNMKYQAGIAEEVANGNLTVQVDVKSSDDVLTSALKKLVEDNLHALSNISDAGSQVTVSSSQVASASQALAQGSTEQASAIEQITASIDEIADKTKANAEEANSAAGLVARAIADVKQGNKQMQDMMVAMQDINKSSESISKIIKTIDDIAFQTNILALNAAVEAARAGEAGKGFAVVAEEVRSLAAKSAAASGETAELIEESIERVSAGSKIADETAKAMEEISKVVQESELIINGIAESSNYQATAVAQIEQAITQVSQVVQTNSATSEQCAAASEELSNQASRMKEMLSIYNLGSGHAASSYSGSSYSSSSVSNANEQVISLGDDFGKY